MHARESMMALRLKSLSQPAELRAAVANNAGTASATAWRAKRARDAPQKACKTRGALGFHKRKISYSSPRCAPHGCTLGRKIAGLVHPRKTGSNVVVITSALHAVGRRFEPGIQYDSLFFAPRGVDSPRASHTNFYAREPVLRARGRKEVCRCEF